MRKKVLKSNRIRRINGGFSFIPHRFLTDGFLASLGQIVRVITINDGVIFKVFNGLEKGTTFRHTLHQDSII